MSTQIQITPSSGITVGTTPVTSGTIGRVFFQWSGDVVQQDSNFVWDNTNKRLGVGISLPQARLDVKAQGALSTDIALRVRNSADNEDVINIKGNGAIHLLGNTQNGRIELTRSGGNAIMKHRATAILPSIFKIQSSGDGGSVSQIQFDAFDGNTPALTVQRLISGLSDLTGSSLNSGFGTNAATFVMKNALNYGGVGVVPTGTAADHFAMYSADITAGNAAPHFRTENGAVIKLYQQSSAGISTVGDIVTVLQNLGLLS